MAVAVLMTLLGAVGLLGSYWIGSLLAIVLGGALGIATWRQARGQRDAKRNGGSHTH